MIVNAESAKTDYIASVLLMKDLKAMAHTTSASSIVPTSLTNQTQLPFLHLRSPDQKSILSSTPRELIKATKRMQNKKRQSNLSMTLMTMTPTRCYLTKLNKNNNISNSMQHTTFN
jgi:hypothetical protein